MKKQSRRAAASEVALRSQATVGGRASVCAVDDDQSVREALPDLLGQLGFAAHTFASAEELLGSDQLETADRLLLDVAMPGIRGPQLQEELRRRGCSTPIVFITAHSNEALRQQLIRQGAVECPC
jgi:FixJ family two-component response regulator